MTHRVPPPPPGVPAEMTITLPTDDIATIHGVLAADAAWLWAQDKTLAEVRDHLWSSGLWRSVAPCHVCAPFGHRPAGELGRAGVVVEARGFDLSGSASSQHYIDTGLFLRAGEELTVEAATSAPGRL